jgi:hypothetical protein
LQTEKQVNQRSGFTFGRKQEGSHLGSLVNLWQRKETTVSKLSWRIKGSVTKRKWVAAIFG